MSTSNPKDRHLQRRFLAALREKCNDTEVEIDFLSSESAALLGTQVHNYILSLPENTVHNWNSARQQIIEHLTSLDNIIVLENQWSLGAFSINTNTLNITIDAIYNLVGPDFYAVSFDLSRGCVFDNEEYHCSLRMW